MPKATLCKKSIDVEKSLVVFTFATEPEKRLVVDYAKLNSAMRLRAGLHGMSQKVGDAHAGAANADEAFELSNITFKRVVADGEWGVERVGGEPAVTQLAQALSRHNGKPLAECVKVLESKDKDFRKKMRESAEIQTALAHMQLEKAKKAPSIKDLLK